MGWYALFVETGKEEDIQKYIQRNYSNFMSSIVPKRKVPEKRNGQYHYALKMLFPGYILLNTDMNDDKYYTLKQIPKLIKVLGNGTSYSPIPEAEISTVIKLISYDGIIEYSKLYIENSVAYVKDGPLKGLEGIIRKIDKHTNRAKIQINFMGAPRIVQVGIEIIE